MLLICFLRLCTKAQKGYQKQWKYVICCFTNNTIILLKPKSLGTSSKSINNSGWTPKVEPQGGLPGWTPKVDPQSWKPLKTIIPVCLCVFLLSVLWVHGAECCCGAREKQCVRAGLIWAKCCCGAEEKHPGWSHWFFENEQGNYQWFFIDFRTLMFELISWFLFCFLNSWSLFPGF